MAIHRAALFCGTAAGLVIVAGLQWHPARVAGPRGTGAKGVDRGKDGDSCGACASAGASGAERLTPEQRRVMRCGGTESPFSGEHWDRKAPGLYRCAACGRPLFKSSAKYDSGSGWPSFFEPAGSGSVGEREDRSQGMIRMEIVCSGCGAHLGHVFEDGPEPTGRRYCVNSVSLGFEPAAKADRTETAAPADEPTRTRQAMFAAGCFWGVEAAFRGVEGVVDTAVGYSGGSKAEPTYEEVCTDRTGHAEAVLVTYDPDKVSYRELLNVFWRIHDPTQADRQGPDVGRQYRSAVFHMDDDQRREAEASRDELARSGRLARPIATEIAAAGPFYRAEEHHQRYHEKHGRKGCPAR